MEAPSKGVPIAYQLPTDGPLPKTYRLIIAITNPTASLSWH